MFWTFNSRGRPELLIEVAQKLRDTAREKSEEAQKSFAAGKKAKAKRAFAAAQALNEAANELSRASLTFQPSYDVNLPTFRPTARLIPHNTRPNVVLEKVDALLGEQTDYLRACANNAESPIPLREALGRAFEEFRKFRRLLPKTIQVWPGQK